MITLVEDLLLETGEVVHDERLLSGIHEVDAVGCGDQPEAANGKQVTEFVSHYLKLYLIQMEPMQSLFIPSARIYQNRRLAKKS